MDTEMMYILDFAERLRDMLDSVSMNDALNVLYEFGKFYAEHHKLYLDTPPEHVCYDCANSELDKKALEAFKKVAAMAYARVHRLDNENEDEDNDSWVEKW